MGRDEDDAVGLVQLPRQIPLLGTGGLLLDVAELVDYQGQTGTSVLRSFQIRRERD